MAGTKQIRFGKVEKKIENFELLLKVYKDALKICPEGSFEYGVYYGKVEAIELTIESLKELGL